MGVVSLLCNLGGKLDMTIQVEVVQADLPLLLGNTTLKKALAVLYLGENKIKLLNEVMDLEDTDSGHFSISVQASNACKGIKVSETVCLAMTTMEELSEKDISKLHHYWGHCPAEKLEKLILNAGKMTDKIKAYLAKIKDTCESCRIFKNRRPRQVLSIPRAMKPNQIVTLDLKEWEGE